MFRRARLSGRPFRALVGRIQGGFGGITSGLGEVLTAVRARPRHRSANRSALPAVVASVGLAIPLTGVLFALNSTHVKPPRTNFDSMPNARIAQDFGAGATVDLPAATTAPAPSPPQLQSIPNLPAHEVFNFAPYWALAQAGGFQVQDMSTVAYFSLDVNPDGSVNESGPGWTGYQSQALVDLIDRAHAAQDRVVLTVTCFDQHSLDQISSNPASSATRLAGTLVNLLSAKSLDGVNIDFEGNGAQDRSGLDAFVSDLSSQLRTVNPHWQITIDTYASSAGDGAGFFDVPGLARSVDGFFVMAYDMEDPAVPSATAPLSGPGSTDASALEEYEAVVPASKIVLGIPAYGYDWPTNGPGLGAAATGQPTAVPFAQLASMSPVYWNPTTQTPWAAYQSNNQWHQVFFDNPTSIALKARLAESMHVAGVGLWALGMDGNDPAIYEALLGSASASKYSIGPTQSSNGAALAAPGQSPSQPQSPGPGSPPSQSSPGGSGGSSGAAPPTTTPSYQYSGVWDGHTESLQPANGQTLPGGGKGTSAGQLTNFQTNDPSVSCLSQGPPLAVTELSSDPTEYVVTASKPTDCANGTWTFSATPLPSGSSPLPSLPSGTNSLGPTGAGQKTL